MEVHVPDFEGVYSLLLTPFRENGSIDWVAHDRYVAWQLEHQPSGLFAVCGTSEMAWLEADERVALARRAVDLAGEVPVVATGNLGLDRSTHDTEIARLVDAGVAGVVLVPPAGLGRDQDALGDYLAERATRADAPTLLYEWPFNTPEHVAPKTIARLADLGLRAVKDTTCTLEGIVAKIDAAPTVAVHQANTPYLLDAIDAGARGMMAITSGPFADLGIAAFDAANDRARRPEAQHLHHDLVTVDACLRMSYPRTAKAFLQQRGVDIGMTCRWPGRLDAEVAKVIEVVAARLAQR